MNPKPLKNVAHSIRQRLLNQAKQRNHTLDELVQYYAMERLLYRLSISTYAENFVLKGALLLRVHSVDLSRITRDIDFLGRNVSNAPMALLQVFKDALSLTVEEDGLRFDLDHIETSEIKKDADYKGIRLIFRGTLDSIKFRIQADIGFGDIVHPSPLWIEYPVLLDHQVPVLLGYTKESAVAEKFHAIVVLDRINTRLKDFYDIWFLAQHFSFQKSAVALALEKTFQNRKTALPTELPFSFTTTWIQDTARQSQWKAFLKKNRLEVVSLQDVVSCIERFVLPVLESLARSEKEEATWSWLRGWA